ncbi:MAG: hypothetical protein Q8N23_29035 [Archangium sp.]|nr:hypothetical protein [Archangium sp.]MDP3156750.1 hypothetical protein [Archangium sp.]MDP3574632.1 hypothetical protein [Archangium sp.]
MLRKRGAAAVELAVTMVLLVPLILYTLFLEDLLAYKLESQEPTVTAGWDYITNDYMRGRKDIGRLNRLKFCDHSAAFDSFDVGYDCNGVDTGGSGSEDTGAGSGAVDVTGGSGGGGAKGHHQAGAAHQCWLVPGADQVRCSIDSTGGAMATMVGTAAPMYTASGWNKGGIVTCKAKLGVMNYMLPMKFMEWAGKNDVSNKGRNSAGAGDNATFTQIDAATKDTTVHDDKNNAGNAWVLTEETFAVMADPWALNDIEDVDPSKGSPMTSFLKPGMIPGQDIYHPLLDRSGHYYNRYAGDANSKAKDWFDNSAISGSNGLLNKSVLFGAAHDGIAGMGGDNPASLPVKWEAAPSRPGDPDGYASGWADQRQSQASSSRSQYPWQ